METRIPLSARKSQLHPRPEAVPLRIDVITIFPELFEIPLKTSLLGKAIAGGKMDVKVHDLRAF
jgi:hypothetical protein